MLKRANRLSREEISEVLKGGISKTTPVFSVKYLKSPFKISKFAFVASKKEFGSSVMRNKAKRRAKSALLKAVGSPKNPLFVMFFLKKGVIMADFQEVVEEMGKIAKFITLI